MGDIDHSPSRVRVGQEFELTMRAFDQDSNGGIEYFMIDWDAEDDEDELEVIYVDGSQTALARVSHTYSETGPKTITITVADNGFVDDSNPDRLINEKKFASTLYDVNVRVL
jgi:NAD kinase